MKVLGVGFGSPPKGREVDMLLTLSERFALIDILPPQGDILTLKALRLLREELAVGEEDRKEVQFYSEFQCAKCGTKDVFPAPVKCGICGEWLRPTGQIGCSNWEFTREIPIPDYLLLLITTTLRGMNDRKLLKERHIGIYERFIPAEVPEAIKKSMEEQC